MMIANSRPRDSDNRIRLADLSPTTPKRLELAVCAAASKRTVFLKKQVGGRASRRLNTCGPIGDDEIGDKAPGGKGACQLAAKSGRQFR